MIGLRQPDPPRSGAPVEDVVRVALARFGIGLHGAEPLGGAWGVA
jgi:hypothetical protein